MFTAFEIEKNVFSNIIMEEMISSLSYSDSCRVLQEQQKVFTPDVIVQSFFINFLEGQAVNVDPKREKMNAAFKGVFSTLKTVMGQHNEKEKDPFEFAFNGKIDKSNPVDDNEYVEAFIYFLLSEKKSKIANWFKQKTPKSYNSALQAFKGGKKQGGGASSNISKLLIDLVKQLTGLLEKGNERNILFFITQNLENNNLKQEENKNKILTQLVKTGKSYKNDTKVVQAIEILIEIVKGEKDEEEIRKMAAKTIKPEGEGKPRFQPLKHPIFNINKKTPRFQPLKHPMFNINKKTLSESKIRISKRKVNKILSEEVEKLFNI